MPTRCNRWYLLQILLHAQHLSGNTMPIIRSSRVLYRWSLPVVFGALVFRLSVWRGATICIILSSSWWWACNKICNKYHLLHLVGILFPQKVTIFACPSQTTVFYDVLGPLAQTSRDTFHLQAVRQTDCLIFLFYWYLLLNVVVRGVRYNNSMLCCKLFDAL